MAKSGFGLDAVAIKKEKPAGKKAQQPSATSKQQKALPAINYRIDAADRKALKAYAANNDTTVTDLLNKAVRLLAIECDISLSDKIMKP